MASGGVDCGELGSATALLDPSAADESAGALGGAAVVPLVADALGGAEVVEVSAVAAGGAAGAVLADTSPLTVALSEGALAVEGGSLEVFESSAERSREVERVEAARWEDFVAT